MFRRSTMKTAASWSMGGRRTFALSRRPMSTIKGDVDTTTAKFQENAGRMQDLIADLRAKMDLARQGGGPKANERHVKRGKILPRERILHVLDKDQPYLELSPLAGLDLYPKDGVPPGGGGINIVGKVNGTYAAVMSSEATVKGGTIYPIGVKKQLRLQEIGLRSRLPCVYIIESGGANLPHQAEIFPDKENGGRVFYNEARMSALGIPQVAVVLGNCTAGGAYVPAMCDEVVIVKGQGYIFLGGPPLVKAATGEIVSAEDLGGADLHCRVSGVTDHYAQNDAEALDKARDIFTTLNVGELDSFAMGDWVEPQEPLYSAADIDGLVADASAPYPVQQVIARLVDGSVLKEFKPLYGDSLVTGFARLDGRLIGVVANNTANTEGVTPGVLSAAGALKGAHFVSICDRRKIPLLFLQNASGGFADHESVRCHARMINAVACSRVPKVTVVIGNSLGPGVFPMCGRAMSPDYLFLWPHSRVGAISPDETSTLPLDSPDEAGALKEILEKQTSAYHSTARMWDDGILEPTATRDSLIVAFEASQGALAPPPDLTRFAPFRM